MRIGDKVKLTQIAKENDCYSDFKNKVLIVTNIAKNSKEHPGFDDSLKGQNLYDFIDGDGNDIPCSLYDYEVKRCI